MPNTNSNLLSPTEILDIYGVPILNDLEHEAHFTLNQAEMQRFKTYAEPKNAIYFIVCLVFFKIKHTFVEFEYEDIQAELLHVKARYFDGDTDGDLSQPLVLDTNTLSLPGISVRSRIKRNILNLCGYQRFTGAIKHTVYTELRDRADTHPRQRQLCREFLNACTSHNVVIPGYTILQAVVSDVWTFENNRVIRAFARHTSKAQRLCILSLMDKVDRLHQIISIKQDMKSFNTHDLWSEIDKQEILKPIFEIAKVVIPKLSLPNTTISYYANLIHYYSAPGLKQLKPDSASLYLICYTYMRYQTLNDNLLEAFKKRTSDLIRAATDYAKVQSLKYLDKHKNIRERASNLLIAIDSDPHPTYVLKETIYTHFSKDELLIAAKLLVDDNLNKDFLFWQYIDSQRDSIVLNLRHLFLQMDFIVINHEVLRDAVAYVKKYLEDGTLRADNLPESCASNLLEIFKKLFVQGHHEYIIKDEKIMHNRCEFLLYKQMVYHLSTNKLTLQYSIKHKAVEDEILTEKKWKKDKKAILKKLDYEKLSSPIKTTLDSKRSELTELYKTVNHAIQNGDNKYVKTKKNNKGKDVWSLSPIEALINPNDSIFAELQQRSIVDVIRFVNQKTEFSKVFDPILAKGSKGAPDIDAITAAIFANAIRMGARKMASSSDLNKSQLLTAEASYVRTDPILAAIDKVNNEVAKFPIYKQWYINSCLHGSIDGLKLGASEKNIKARRSKKYFNDGIGVSGYNEIVNFLSVAGRLIGANEYEGHFAFEMVHNLNTSEIKPKHISTDKHGVNALNFALFDLTDLVFAPRIPKPHKETLWGFGCAKDYDGLLVKPTQFIDEQLLHEEWDNIQRLVASILTGEVSPSIIIRKLSSSDYSSNTKKAFVQYNHIVRSKFILLYLHDYEFRRAIMYALNRGELYNSMYRSIAILNNGELKGKNEIDMEIWNQCTRLIAAIMHFYNAYILNNFYINTTDPEDKAFLAHHSPTAWVHFNFLGHYQFRSDADNETYEKLIDQWIERHDWRKTTKSSTTKD